MQQNLMKKMRYDFQPLVALTFLHNGGVPLIGELGVGEKLATEGFKSLPQQVRYVGRPNLKRVLIHHVTLCNRRSDLTDL